MTALLSLPHCRATVPRWRQRRLGRAAGDGHRELRVCCSVICSMPGLPGKPSDQRTPCNYGWAVSSKVVGDSVGWTPGAYAAFFTCTFPSSLSGRTITGATVSANYKTKGVFPLSGNW